MKTLVGFRRSTPALALLAAATLLAACATGLARRDDGAKFRYQDYAGPPIDEVTSMGRVSGWSAVSRNQLVIWTGVNEAWLLKVWDSCRDLDFAETINVTRTGSRISKFDKVVLPRETCPISEIRKVDVKQMQADRKAAKAKP